MTEPRFSAEEIATHMGIANTVCDWTTKNWMPAHRVGRLWKVQAGEIDEWVRSGGAAPGNEHKGGDA